MKSIHIRNVPAETLDALKRLAESHHRSLQGELLTILERAAQMAPLPQVQPLELNFVTSGTREFCSRSEIYEDHR